MNFEKNLKLDKEFMALIAKVYPAEFPAVEVEYAHMNEFTHNNYEVSILMHGNGMLLSGLGTSLFSIKTAFNNAKGHIKKRLRKISEKSIIKFKL